MKIAVISDTHDNLTNLIKALTFINQQEVSALIHCGDVTNIETFRTILNYFNKPIYLSFGNGDDSKVFNDFLNQNKNNQINFFNEFGEFNLNNFKIGISHFPEVVKKVLQNKKDYDFIFYGHTHKPWEEKENKTIILNPGNLAGIFYKPTFALVDFSNFEKKLIIL
ncbi:MAG: phosphoesterase [Candidatus Parcubacteria bacterium]|nr:MAG: phosphoesterase [Candidatus Parcubacteria bacterium]